MNKAEIIIPIVAIILVGCSPEQREEAIERTTRAARELNGMEGREPDVVREAKRKEWMRQNTKWTKENQALHPVEYCQEQLSELERMSKVLQVQYHSIASAKAAAVRKQTDGESQIVGLSKLLTEIKSLYRVADASNNWPIVVNGFQLSKERAQEKIVDAANSISSVKIAVAHEKEVVVALAKKALRLDAEQRKLISIRERVQAALDDLRTKQVVDGANGISDALNAISDSIASLGCENDDPALDDLIVPDANEERLMKFNEIMSND